jgi:hypothetical protein
MYRVKEVNGVFIAQINRWYGWIGLSTNLDYTWYSDKNQFKFCKHTSLQKAIERINKEGYPENFVKYHKI